MVWQQIGYCRKRGLPALLCHGVCGFLGVGDVCLLPKWGSGTFYAALPLSICGTHFSSWLFFFPFFWFTGWKNVGKTFSTHPLYVEDLLCQNKFSFDMMSFCFPEKKSHVHPLVPIDHKYAKHMSDIAVMCYICCSLSRKYSSFLCVGGPFAKNNFIISLQKGKFARCAVSTLSYLKSLGCKDHFPAGQGGGVCILYHGATSPRE